MGFLDHARSCGTVIVLAVGVAACAKHQQHGGAPDWQLKLLMTPTPSQIAAEQRGRVFIYDSLEMGHINNALDRNFDRIENMMFTRIYHLPPTGAGPVEIEDDGCD